jgi:DNA-3-methyladenine glycosylase
MYYCLHVSCLPDGKAGGVLFRAIEPLEGLQTMARLRGLPDISKPRLLTSGPGRLCQALGITRALHDAVDVTSGKSPLQILDDGFRPVSVLAKTRIGISKATDRPLRFLEEGSIFVSKP